MRAGASPRRRAPPRRPAHDEQTRPPDGRRRARRPCGRASVRRASEAQPMNSSADLVLHNGQDHDARPAEARGGRGRDPGRPLRRGRQRAGGHGLGRPGRERVDLQGPARHPGADRQPHARHPRRPELQHGAALGRRALARRRDAHAEGAGRRTPPPQWVRVVGGFTEHQFAEKRLPTLDEINAVAPDTPVFILHLYDRALLNARRAARGRLHQGHAGPPGRRDRRATRTATRPGCCSPSPTPRSSTRRSPRGRSCRPSTR